VSHESASGGAQVRFERPSASVARIVLNRPDKRNAQGNQMTYELDAAFKRACHEDDVRVIVLAGAGDHFCAGHDLAMDERWMPNADESVGLWGQYGAPGWEGNYSREKELYLEITERWRNAPKPTIAEVQGSVIAGGNTLAWACDLIVAADDARFRDLTIEMSMPGPEFAAAPFELGVRKAKEWMFTGGWLDARDAEARGMVNHVVPRNRLTPFVLELASRIAEKDRFALKLMKETINQAQDAMGRPAALAYSFAMHQLGHVHNHAVHGFPIDYTRLTPAVRARIEAFIAAKRAAPEDDEGSFYVRSAKP
jgi:enoyl-CoA hydratase